jgi:enoyl-CoA hydratase
MSQGISQEPEILFERKGCAGFVTLNRPQALNAATDNMVRQLAKQLDLWENDSAIDRVVVKAAGDRAFCAGGDIRALYEQYKAGEVQKSIDFWRVEYTLNHRIKHYPKPYIALIDGIVMGGGVGLSLHGTHRVAGDKYSFAYPEVGIGFFPDVGATHVLPRLPGKIGMWIGLTGWRVSADDGVYCGLASHRVASAQFAELESALTTDESVGEILKTFSKPREKGKLEAEHPLIDRIFALPSVEEILGALDGEMNEFASQLARAMRQKSPLSLKIAFEQVQRGGSLDFAEAMQTEFRIVNRVAREPEFYEGIRAVVIDKDNAPKWNPASLEAVREDKVASYFAPLPPAEELKL